MTGVCGRFGEVWAGYFCSVCSVCLFVLVFGFSNPRLYSIAWDRVWRCQFQRSFALSSGNLCLGLARRVLASARTCLVYPRQTAEIHVRGRQSRNHENEVIQGLNPKSLLSNAQTTHEFKSVFWETDNWNPAPRFHRTRRPHHFFWFC